MENSKPIYIKGLIIIIAVYCNQNKEPNNCVISCLRQIRKFYEKETIILVDNKSLNTEWHNVANELGAIILYNDSDFYRFEMGAYRLALQNFRADEYIFCQGTMFFNHKIIDVLKNKEADALAFQVLNGLYWTQLGLNLINNLLNKVGMNNWNNDPLVVHDSFYCNDLFVIEFLNSGLLDLPCDTKNHSCAFERILGSFFNTKLGYVKQIQNNTVKKISFAQDPVTL